jgi:Cys-tRNA(Pro)/Cys-tRNA(Cys) deacylase
MLSPGDDYASRPMGEDLDTPALRALPGTGLAVRVVRTAPPDNVDQSAVLQGIRVEQLLRTIVIRRGADDYLFVLVPGGRHIDWPRLRAHLGVSRLSLPDREEAKAATGYDRGTITPFGSSRAWPVIVDAGAMGEAVVAIGGGGRGVNLHLSPRDLVEHLRADVADVTREAEGRSGGDGS